jgi:hypothetical protein
MKLRIIREANCMYMHKLQRKVFGLFWLTLLSDDLKACERAMNNLAQHGAMYEVIKELK